MTDDEAVEQMAEVVRSITSLMVNQQMVGVDFNDLRSILERQQKKGRRSFVGHGEASGEHRATEAAELAIVALKKNIALGR